MPSKSNKTPVYSGAERAKFIEVLEAKTHFSKTEIEKLLRYFKDTCPPGKKVQLDKSRFFDFLHYNFDMTDSIMVERVFKVFDKSNDGYISEAEWVKGLSVLLRGTEEELREFTFAVYDMHSHLYLSREEMFGFLQKCLVMISNEEDQDEGIKDMVEITLKLLGTDKESKVTQELWNSAVKRDSLLMECLGPCLPAKEKANAYLNLIGDVPSERKNPRKPVQQKLKKK